MKPKRSGDSSDLWIIGIGFGFTILLLLGSAYAAVEAMEQGQSRMISITQEQQITDKLTDEIQGEEAGLSSLFYALARAGNAPERTALLERLTAVEADIERTFSVTMARSDAARWRPVKDAVQLFTRNLRRAMKTSKVATEQATDDLFRSHEILARELATLVTANYQHAVDAQTREHDLRRGSLRYAFYLLIGAVVISIVCAIYTMHRAHSVFNRARWQARELSRLSGHVLETQDSVIRRLSRELHDEFGQTLSAIEANLAAVPATTPDQQSRIEDCMLLVKDVMSNVRELSQLLRPSILDDFGLNAGLQWLADSFHQRTGIEVEAHIEHGGRLPGETETHLFRIAQEALTNVVRHSGAKRVTLSLGAANGRLTLTIADDGKGLAPKEGRTGFGMMGMRERMRAAGGELHVRSTPKGLTITAEVPVESAVQPA
ncbi:MAG: sensor histidine kinase [Acidobacteria bacterium]|nr:sensor histidine kinase [Acidobacteriota bacterium]